MVVTPETKRRKMMMEIAIALAVGLAIGVLFQLLKLPVPVPHGWGGMAGLIGMFAGSVATEQIVKRFFGA